MNVEKMSYVTAQCKRNQSSSKLVKREIAYHDPLHHIIHHCDISSLLSAPPFYFSLALYIGVYIIYALVYITFHGMAYLPNVQCFTAILK